MHRRSRASNPCLRAGRRLGRTSTADCRCTGLPSGEWSPLVAPESTSVWPRAATFTSMNSAVADRPVGQPGRLRPRPGTATQVDPQAIGSAGRTGRVLIAGSARCERVSPRCRRGSPTMVDPAKPVRPRLGLEMSRRVDRACSEQAASRRWSRPILGRRTSRPRSANVEDLAATWSRRLAVESICRWRRTSSIVRADRPGGNARPVRDRSAARSGWIDGPQIRLRFAAHRPWKAVDRRSPSWGRPSAGSFGRVIRLVQVRRAYLVAGSMTG